MALHVAKFLANPGRRLPIDLTLRGGTDPESLCTVESIGIHGEAFTQLATLYFEVTLEARLKQPCRRCLDPVTSILTLEETFEVPIPPGTETIDLLPIVLRLVLSAREPNVLCREECRGLCPTCGINLNRHPDHTCADDSENRTTLRDFLE